MGEAYITKNGQLFGEAYTWSPVKKLVTHKVTQYYRYGH